MKLLNIQQSLLIIGQATRFRNWADLEGKTAGLQRGQFVLSEASSGQGAMMR
jgi:replicative DNA helicase